MPGSGYDGDMATTDERIVAYLQTQPSGAAPHQIMHEVGLSKKTVTIHLRGLREAGRVVRRGELPDVVYAVTGSESGIMNNELRDENKTRTTEPPLFQMKITNPVTYLRRWWSKVMANEGVDLHLKIKPLTAIAMVIFLSGGSFALGRISLPASSPIVKYVPQLGPTPTPNPWKETAYRGILRYTPVTKKYRLEVGDGEAITLQTPGNVNMSSLVGKKIFAAGRFNTVTQVLVVAEAEDLEVLVKVAPVPTVATDSAGSR